jgi:hypothetical protein
VNPIIKKQYEKSPQINFDEEDEVLAEEHNSADSFHFNPNANGDYQRVLEPRANEFI